MPNTKKLILIVVDNAISKYSPACENIREYISSEAFLNSFPGCNVAYFEHYKGKIVEDQYLFNGKHYVLKIANNTNATESDKLAYAFNQISKNAEITISKILYFGSHHAAYQYCKLSHELPIEQQLVYLGDEPDKHIVPLTLNLDKPGYLLHGGVTHDEKSTDSRKLLRSIFFTGNVVTMNHEAPMDILIDAFIA